MSTSTTGWRIEKHSPSVVDLQLGDSDAVLLLTDIHWDNAKCDRAALKRDLDEAVKRNVPVLLIGDTFCLMQGKWDPRSSRSQLMPEHATNDEYLDLVIKDAAKWFAPYASVLALSTPGNHETNIAARHGTNPTEALHSMLIATVPAYKGVTGAYAGFAAIGKNRAGKSVGKQILCWHHGYGGGGEVTRGMIDHSRSRSQYDADIYVSGHIHRRNMDENEVTCLNTLAMRIETRRQIFLRSGTYKREDGADAQNMGGWHVEKGRSARPIGGWWVNFRLHRDTKNTRTQAETCLRAQPVPTWG